MIRMPGDEAQRLNQAIDRYLLEPGAVELETVLELAARRDAARCGERVRRRATRLGRAQRTHRAEIIRARDRLIVWLYAQAVPVGWCMAWSDGSWRRQGDVVRAGIGGLVLAAQGRTVLAELSAAVAAGDALHAEVMAVAAVLEAALAHGVQRLCVHSDCDALVALWRRHPDDARLEALRTLTEKLYRFELRPVARQHNQLAHRLARRAMTGKR